jgi:general secretion pathway protein G
MGVSTVIGKKQLAVGSEQLAEVKQSRMARFLLPTANCQLPTVSRGFTLLELMIVISIIIILAAIAMPQYQKTVVHAKETVLHDDLFQFRKTIDMYAADKGKLPQSLQDLVDAGYMRDIPIDPMTDRNDTWVPETGEDPNSADGGQGITDVRSGSTDTSTEGNSYNEW